MLEPSSPGVQSSLVNPSLRPKYLRGLILQTIPGKSFDGAREQLQIFGEIFTPVLVNIANSAMTIVEFISGAGEIQ